MIKFEPSRQFYISKDLLGYADKLIQEGTFRRRVDLLLLGFAFAVRNEIVPAEEYQRHDLIYVNNLKKMLLPVEVAGNWYARQLGYILKNDKELLDFVCAVGIAGTRELKERWSERRKSQIQWDILDFRTSL